MNARRAYHQKYYTKNKPHIIALNKKYYDAHKAVGKAALLASLKEMRDAMAAAWLVIAQGRKAPDRFRTELEAAGVKPGFGKRADDLIAKIEGHASDPAAQGK